MQRGVAVEKRVAIAHLDRQQVAQIAVGEQPLDRTIHTQRHRRGHNLCDKLRLCARGIAHSVGLARVHRHARFTQHMFAGVQRRQRHAAVHVRPGANHNRIGVGRGNQLLPAVVDRRDAELIGDALRRRAAAVADADDFGTLQSPAISVYAV